MKQKLYIGLLIAAALLPSCSDDADGNFPSNRLIRLSTGITPPTRAALNRFDGETVAFAKGTASGSYTESWQAVARPGETRLLGAHTYPDDQTYLYLRGYYPVKPLVDGKVAYRLDGDTDLMATTEQKGNLTDNFSLSDKTFYFNHLLTQVSFEVRTSREETNTLRLVSVTVAGSRPDAMLLLSGGTATGLPEVTFSGEPQQLTGYVEPERGGGVPLSRETALLPHSLLVEPGAELLLDVKAGLPDGTTRLYSGLPVRFDESDGKSRAGTAYRLTLTLYPSGTSGGDGTVAIGAAVAPWLEDRGNGTVE
ncbi:fimbrillin family protein [Parabacteroides sp.]